MEKTENQTEGIFKETEIVTNKQSILPVVLILLIFFLIIESGVIFLSGFLSGNIKNLDIKTEINLGAKIKSSPKNQQVELKITEGELADGLTNSNISLYNPSVSIMPDAIYISGRTSKSILSLHVKAKVVPAVKDGKIVLDIINFESDGISAPQSIIDTASPKINQYLKEFINLPDNFVVSGVNLFKSYLVIHGQTQ